MADPLSTAAIGWGLTATGWFVSPYITRLLDKAYAHIKPAKSREKIRFLVNHTVPRLKLILEAAEGSEHKHLFEQLLTDLRSAFYATEDVLDEIEYVRRHQSGRKRKLDSCLDEGPSNQSVGTLATFPGTLSALLKENVTKIEELIKQAHTTIDSANLQSNKRRAKTIARVAENNIYPTISDPMGKVTGREKVLEELTEMLRQPTSSGSAHLSVIGIIGIPGSGKTTLAQCVCGFEKSAGYFDFVIWIHVSENFTVRTIYSEMLEQAWKKSVGNEVRPQYSSLVMLKEELKKALNGKRFLLVLDDIWFNKEEAASEQKLQQLLIPLKDGKEGSKILVTSRQDSLSHLGPDVTTVKFQIPDLDDEFFLKLFMHYALNYKLVDKEDKGKLQQIGAQIAQKLKKSPLLARVVGGILFQKPTVEVRDWLSVRDQNLLDKYMGALWWSYQHLSEQVRRCFAYCSIFSRRYHLHRDELVNLWVAEGFITTTNGGQDLEDVGRGYFNELVSISFLLLGGKDNNDEEYFLIHDLLHDLAVNVAGSDCFKIENGWTEEPSLDVRHIFIQNCTTSMVTNHIVKLKKLRTLIIYNGEHDINFDKMFSELGELRVLIFGTDADYLKCSLLSFPESIGCLKHLRYLDFQIKGPDVILPRTLDKLYLLQVLRVSSSWNFCFSFGDDMTKFADLRYVPSSGFPNIGRLTSLQTLSCFYIDQGKGYEIHQLKHLNKLQGYMRIRGLELVQSKEEALEAKLLDKERLTELNLTWDPYGRGFSPDVQADVIEGLYPPKYLRRLTILDYHSSRYPSWMVGPHKSTMHLQQLTLCRCGQPVTGPELFFITVSSLLMHECNSWDSLPYNMEHLTSLELDNCYTFPSNMEHLTSLKSLIIRDWVPITKFPTLQKSLGYIQFIDCLSNSTQSMIWDKIKHIHHIVIDGKKFEGLDDEGSEATVSERRAGSTTYLEEGSGADPADEDSEERVSYGSAGSRTDAEGKKQRGVQWRVAHSLEGKDSHGQGRKMSQFA